ncbi:phage tail protein I [Vibrio parahaemolyticus]|nr:phage tail protein I [Vibrio parahaemolyticus]
MHQATSALLYGCECGDWGLCMTDKVSILPANVSDLERDLDIALARIEDVEIPISTLWDPWKCPLDVLPFLAWAVSVDMWRTDWPETVKRRIVASSLSVHRKKALAPR